VLVLQGVGDIRDRQPPGLQLGRVEPDPDLPLPEARGLHVADPVDRLEAGLEDLVDEEGLLPVGGGPQHGDGHQGGIGGGEFLHHRGLRLVGQIPERLVDLVPHVRRRRVDVSVQAELDHRDRLPLVAAGGEALDAGDAGELLLQHVRHVVVHDGGVGTGHGGAHRHHGKIHVRDPLDPHPPQGQQAEDHQGERADRGRDGPPQADLGNLHLVASSRRTPWSTSPWSVRTSSSDPASSPALNSRANPMRVA